MLIEYNYESHLEQQPFFFLVVASDEGCFKTGVVGVHQQGKLVVNYLINIPIPCPAENLSVTFDVDDLYRLMLK